MLKRNKTRPIRRGSGILGGPGVLGSSQHCGIRAAPLQLTLQKPQRAKQISNDKLWQEPDTCCHIERIGPQQLGHDRKIRELRSWETEAKNRAKHGHPATPATASTSYPEISVPKKP